MKRRPQLPARKQPTPPELIEALLGLIESKFYRGFPVPFAKDKQRLLQWVVLWPATWFNEKRAPIAANRYREIMFKIILDAAAHAVVEKIKYLPAWLSETVQSHFRMHGEEYYEEAKSIRAVVENALLVAGQRVEPALDVSKDLMAARALLRAAKGQTKPKKALVKEQLTLL